MAFASTIVKAVEAGLNESGRSKLDSFLFDGKMDERDVVEIDRASKAGLKLELLHDAVFLWIADELVDEVGGYRVGPSRSNGRNWASTRAAQFHVQVRDEHS